MNNPAQVIVQDLKAWRAGFKAGWKGGKVLSTPPGVDALSYRSGVVEGHAARSRTIPQNRSHPASHPQIEGVFQWRGEPRISKLAFLRWVFCPLDTPGQDVWNSIDQGY